ncbi:effector-associated constant component EACC1 [Nocardia sp. CA-107356]|uniref:effector-associated constant component EACC1 n=1 Tax=Nocardia sp. CA-107356 TaxID=3239972 RepID=UPI003D8AB171
MIIVTDNSDELRDLAEFLGDTDELRGRLKSQLRPPGPEDMGPILEALEILVGPGGITAATATAIVAWIRSRRADVRLTVRGSGDRIVELDARGVGALDGAELQQLAERLLRTVEPEGQGRAPIEQ